MKFKFSPIAIFFFLTVFGTLFFVTTYYYAYFLGEISWNFFVASIFFEICILLSDFVFIYVYTLYVTTYQSSNSNANEIHAFIVKWLGKLFPSQFNTLLIALVFPFYRKYLMHYTNAIYFFLVKLYRAIKTWFSQPVTFLFVCLLLLFFNLPILYLFYKVELDVEFGDLPLVFGALLFGDFIFILYFFYKKFRKLNLLCNLFGIGIG